MSQSTADLTTKQRHPGAGMCTKLLAMCGHKVKRGDGSVFKGWIPMRCAACNEGKKQ